MRPELILSQRPELRLQLSPQLIQRIEILQLGAADLQDLIEKELLSNDLLRTEEELPRQDAGKAEHKAETRDDSATENGPSDSEPRIEMDDWSLYLRPARRPVARGEADPKMEALANTPSRPSTLIDHLDQQLALETLNPAQVELTRYLIRNLDRNGWLKEPLEELIIPLDDTDLEQAEAALEIIQSLDPRGVGARDPAECLLLQMPPGHPDFDALTRLISRSLDDLGRNRLPKVARDLDLSVEEVKRLAEILRRGFDPFPGRRYDYEEPSRVRPDVVVEKVSGRWEVRLEDDYMPRLSVDDVRARALRRRALDPELKKQFRRDFESARWLIESIEQRKRTLERVALQIVDRQEDYLEHGVNHLKPLKMQEVADALGIHVSTVSRAIKGKYMQSPQGVSEMKFFFTGASRGTDGVVESRTGVKERVREIISREDKASPLSDEDIVEKLRTMGLSIARRTVTKYRKSMDIPSSRQRREY